MVVNQNDPQVPRVMSARFQKLFPIFPITAILLLLLMTVKVKESTVQMHEASTQSSAQNSFIVDITDLNNHLSHCLADVSLHDPVTGKHIQRRVLEDGTAVSKMIDAISVQLTDSVQKALLLKIRQDSESYFEQLSAVAEQKKWAGEQALPILRQLSISLDALQANILKLRLLKKGEEAIRQDKIAQSIRESEKMISTLRTGIITVMFVALVMIIYFFQLHRGDSKKLQENNQQQESMLDSIQHVMRRSNEVLCVLKRSGEFIRTSEHALELWGYEQEELQQLNLFHLCESKEERSLLTELIRNLPTQSGAQIMELTILRKDNTFQVSRFSFYWSKKEQLIYAKADDATTMVQLRGQVFEYERLMEFFMNHTREGIVTLNRDYTYRLINKAAEPMVIMMGMGARLAKPGDSMYDFATPGQIERLTTLFEAVLAGKPTGYEVKYPSEQGDKWFEIQGDGLLDDNNEVTGFVVSCRDITARKIAETALQKSEENYRSLMESMQEGLQVLSPDWRYLFVNEAVAKQAMTIRDELHGSSLLERFPQIVGTEVFKRMEACMKNRTSDFLENDFVFRDGTVRSFQVSIQPVPQGLMMLTVDITQRKDAENKLQQLNDELHALTQFQGRVIEEERKRIAREIHDDLGQQLTALKFQVKWLSKRISDETTAGEINALVTLLDELLHSVRRISSDLHPGILDNLGLVAALEWHSKQLAERTGINIQFNSDYDGCLSADVSIALFRGYQELVANAIKHAEATEIAGKLEKIGNVLRLLVKDNGKGFAQQKENGRRKLGIMGVRERIQALGGKIEIETAPGHGSCVKIELHLSSQPINQ